MNSCKKGEKDHNDIMTWGSLMHDLMGYTMNVEDCWTT